MNCFLGLLLALMPQPASVTNGQGGLALTDGFTVSVTGVSDARVDGGG